MRADEEAEVAEMTSCDATQRNEVAMHARRPDRRVGGGVSFTEDGPQFESSVASDATAMSTALECRMPPGAAGSRVGCSC
jgi:hypothetical protein